MELQIHGTAAAEPMTMTAVGMEIRPRLRLEIPVAVVGIGQTWLPRRRSDIERREVFSVAAAPLENADLLQGVKLVAVSARDCSRTIELRDVERQRNLCPRIVAEHALGTSKVRPNLVAFAAGRRLVANRQMPIQAFGGNQCGIGLLVIP